MPLQDNIEPQENQATSLPVASNARASTPPPATSRSSEATEEVVGSTEAKTSQLDSTQPDATTDNRYSFYLLRPRTSSSRRVLIPLIPSNTLGDALRGCMVEEFPTIFYFSCTTSALPAEFILEEDYLKEEGEQQKEFEELMRDVDPEILKRLRDDGTSSRVDEEVDSKRILDVLKQDLGGL